MAKSSSSSTFVYKVINSLESLSQSLQDEIQRIKKKENVGWTAI